MSRYGVIAYGSSLDQVGPLTRTVEDAALVLSVIAGHDKRDSTSSPRPVDNYADFSRADLKGVRLGVPREFMAEGLDGPVAKACQDALDRARDLGAELVDVSLPHATRHAIAAYYIVAMAEASSNLSRFDGVRYGYRAQESRRPLLPFPQRGLRAGSPAPHPARHLRPFRRVLRRLLQEGRTGPPPHPSGLPERARLLRRPFRPRLSGHGVETRLHH